MNCALPSLFYSYSVVLRCGAQQRAATAGGYPGASERRVTPPTGHVYRRRLAYDPLVPNVRGDGLAQLVIGPASAQLRGVCVSTSRRPPRGLASLQPLQALLQPPSVGARRHRRPFGGFSGDGLGLTRRRASERHEKRKSRA